MAHSTAIAEPVIELPSHAPQIRVTAGIGSAGQKTWNLRRPVTLLGSKRPAHIVLHDKGVSAAHAVIINTGLDVLLFDLHTTGGTSRGKEPVDLVALQDGDVINLGETTVQVAIRMPAADPDDSGAGMEYIDPLSMASPVTLNLIHTETTWTIERSVALLGRHELATLRLDNAEVSMRHALLFRFGRQPAIFDLGGKAGIWINGQRHTISLLSDGDRVTVGPFGLQLQVKEPAARTMMVPQATQPTAPAVPAAVPVTAPAPPQPQPAPAKSAAPSKPQPATKAEVAAVQAQQTHAAAADHGPPVDPLQTNIAEAWERLNQWRAQLRLDAAAITQQQTTMTARESQLEARDAALRGQLHDVTRLNEQLAQREIDLAKRSAQVQEEVDALGAMQKEFVDKQAEYQKKDEEIHRREQALSQRWSRMQSTVCPHCQKPISLSGA